MSGVVYMDICSLKRPFDDSRMERIRREAEAVVQILEAVESGKLRLVRSPAHDFENERNPREDRRLATRLWLQAADVHVTAGTQTDERSRELTALGFGPLDALHLAFAEKAGAGWFVTTDDGLLKRAASHRDTLPVQVVRPDQFPLREEGEAR